MIGESMMSTSTVIASNSFNLPAYNSARTFSSFLPGIAGEHGKPLWVFYTNRGQCISSFGIGNKNGAMLEFHPANKAYILTSLLGFRTFVKMANASGERWYEPFQAGAQAEVEQRMTVRPESLELEEINRGLGLRFLVTYFTLPGENLPALVRQVKVENIGGQAIRAALLDGLPQIVPYGLDEGPLKTMSRTMEAFAEIRHVEDALPFYKLKVEPSDKPDVTWIHGGFFAFSASQQCALPIIADPELVFGYDTSLRTPAAFFASAEIVASSGRRETLTGCAFAQISADLQPGQAVEWDSYFGHAPNWDLARDFRARVLADASYATSRHQQNSDTINRIGERFALHAGPSQLDPYSRQSFLDNTLRGGQPIVIEGPRGARVFHAFTRKHGDMERDYNFFEVAPTYWSQGNGNFRDVNQNRRSENFIFPGIDASNIETFFNLIQLDGNNPLVIQFEKFRVPPEEIAALIDALSECNSDEWRNRLSKPFSPGALQSALIDTYGSAANATVAFEKIIGVSDKIQDATHGEGYWVDHWIYNLDLLESYAALYPDKLKHLIVERSDFSYFDSDHTVQPRHKKSVLRDDGSVRQLHAVIVDAEKVALIHQRRDQPHAMRDAKGQGEIYRTTLLVKILNLLVVKISLLDPFGIGLEMEAEKPGWCDALNGLPGLFGSSTHEAFALQRWIRFTKASVEGHFPASGALSLPVEVADFVRVVTDALTNVDQNDFFPTWDVLASAREAYRADVRLGIRGTHVAMSSAELLEFLNIASATLEQGLAKAYDENGLPISYYYHDVLEYDALPQDTSASASDDKPTTTNVRISRFGQRAVNSFLEGAVHALRSVRNTHDASSLYQSVRRSQLYDQKLGMYRVNASLSKETFEIGRSRVFSPGWLENESIFLHMHYKFMLETLRSGLASEFFQDLRSGLIAFQDPKVYGRSPLENSSFIASSCFPDSKAHGVGFVARLSGASAEWISMVLHMGLGASPFHLESGELRFTPSPVLADWLFTEKASGGFGPDTFGFKLFGSTWVVYRNPSRGNTFGSDPVKPESFELNYKDGSRQKHLGRYLPESKAIDLRDGKLSVLHISLGMSK
jgi:hypothetical protein